MVGVAIARTARVGLQSPVSGFFPELAPFAHLDDRKRRITVEDLLTMSSGLSCDDAVDSFPGNEAMFFVQDTQPNFFRLTLDLPMVADPGSSHIAYCSAGINLLGGIASHAVGEHARDVFAEDIADPLRFGRYYLNLTPTEDYYGAGVSISVRATRSS
jgi:CubicO group peptidase (beta-lactamase class C family)